MREGNKPCEGIRASRRDGQGFKGVSCCIVNNERGLLYS